MNQAGPKSSNQIIVIDLGPTKSTNEPRFVTVLDDTSNVPSLPQICADIRTGHEQQGLVKLCQGCKNHKSTAELLTVPWYHDLLEDQEAEDPSERDHVLVSSASSWRIQMVKWIGDSKEVEAAEQAEAAEKALWKTLGDLNSNSKLNDKEDTPRLPKKPKWKPITLAVLFEEAEKLCKRKLSAQVLEKEAQVMEALAEMEACADAQEDSRPNNGTIEID
ncbi:hypothetical protein B0H14DRAFT_2558281 [Mycena olivaceomarginata]|nr:hypothetical protein B0H14DRAFT_2558281 [Mycena olivaceomarginata]